MLTNHAIKSLYPLALAEGEGVGTAYEYVAKRHVLRRWLGQVRSQLPRNLPGRVLIAGLPEIYGTSLDYLLLAAELGWPALVVDDRPVFLAKTEQAAAAAQAQTPNLLAGLQLQFQQVANVAHLAGVDGPFGLAICNEVLQRFPAGERPTYVQRLSQLAPIVTLFAPNAGNAAHTNLSGLAGLHLPEMQTLLAGAGGQNRASGYCDMPPFPPGTTRSESQRAQASSGRVEALAMWGLGWYARGERWFPAGLRRRQAHIVYGLMASSR